MSQRRTHEDRILWLLQASFPNWTPATALADISLQYNARIFALRRKGWQIANRVETVNGVKHGSFRLATPGTRPNPPQRSTNSTSTSTNADTHHNRTAQTFPEFGALEPDRSYAE